MISEYKCPDFHFTTIVDEFDIEKIFFEADNAKLIFADKEIHNLSNVKLYILDDIKVDFELNERINRDYDKFTIEFESSDGWFINIESCYFTFFENRYPVSAKGLNVKIIKGQCSDDVPVRYYKFIENLNLTNECEINEVTCTESDNLFLIKHKDNFFKDIDGYFYIKDSFNNIKDVFYNLYFLLKYYSAGSASMRISHCSADNFEKIEIGLPSHYSNFKYESCFYDTYPNNLFDFLDSTYDSYVRLKNEGLIDVNLLIHYLAFLKRERYVEVELLISAIILEVLTKNHKKIKDSSEAKFVADLRKLIENLDLDFDKLNGFFKEYGVVCDNNKFLSEIVKVRNDIVHGNAVVSQKLCYLMTTFVNILALKLFDIKCAMYIPLIKRNEFTHEFLEQFICNSNEEVEEDSSEIDNQPIEVEEINGKLYLPLELFDSENNIIREGDNFRISEFETKEYGEDCKLNLKMARFVKQ